MLLDFEWDPIKAATNIEKHGISFEEAMAAFDDPSALDYEDAVHSQTELRSHLIGRAGKRLVSVIYTLRAEKIRLITARLASRRERKFYASAKG